MVPMNEDVRATLFTLRRESKSSEYVFVNPDTKKPYTDPKKEFATACRFSEATIAESMGHSHAKTTRRYTHGTDRAKRAAVEAVRISCDRVCHNPATNEERRPFPIAVSA
jgi:integrase